VMSNSGLGGLGPYQAKTGADGPRHVALGVALAQQGMMVIPAQFTRVVNLRVVANVLTHIGHWVRSQPSLQSSHDVRCQYEPTRTTTTIPASSPLPPLCRYRNRRPTRLHPSPRRTIPRLRRPSPRHLSSRRHGSTSKSERTLLRIRCPSPRSGSERWTHLSN